MTKTTKRSKRGLLPVGAHALLQLCGTDEAAQLPSKGPLVCLLSLAQCPLAASLNILHGSSSSTTHLMREHWPGCYRKARQLKILLQDAQGALLAKCLYLHEFSSSPMEKEAIHISIHPPICSPTHLSTHPSVLFTLSTNLATSPSTYSPIHPPIHPIHASTHPSPTCLLPYPFLHLLAHRPTDLCMSTHSSICLSSISCSIYST